MSSPESIPPIHRVTARVLPVNAAGGVLLQAQWWTPEALRADCTAASPDLPDIMVSAIDAVAGGAR
jgi:hypothetical protein